MKAIHLTILALSAMLLSPDLALAQAAAPEQPWWVGMVPIFFMFAVVYFLMIRPQAKAAREKQQYIAQLKRGDEVVTESGILGKIEGLTEQFVTLEIANGVRVKVLRSKIMTSVGTMTGATAEAKT